MSRFVLVRSLITVAVFAGLLIAAGPAPASRPATAWTIYGDVEVAGPKDHRTGVVLRPR